MATPISICSAALLQLGKNPIASFDEDGDLVRQCSNLYPGERDSLLRENDWNCATRRVVLAPSAEDPAYGFAAQFALPGDFIRLLAIGDIRIGTPGCRSFKVQGRSILASGAVLPIEYIYRADESEWDGKLVELMTARMLWKLAYPVTQSTTLRDTLKDEYQAMARAARAIDSSENPTDTFGSEDFPFLAGRL